MLNSVVSVIMPSYNGGKYIDKAIESVLEQTYTDWQLIIVDDCSSDNTIERVTKYKDPRITICKNDVNRGISYTTNKAISVSEGEYIALLDDDDMALSDRLELQVEYMNKHKDIDVLGGNSEIVDDFGNHIRYKNIPHNNPKYLKAMLLFKNVDFYNGTAMIRRSFLDKYSIKYKDHCFGMQDYQFYVDSSKVGKLSAIDNVILRHRVHDNNFTDNIIRSNKKERELAYSLIRKKSLSRSGFVLKEEQIAVIDKMFREIEITKVNKKDIVQLYYILKEILFQANEMQIDYYEELELFLKRIFSERIYRTELFDLLDS